MPREAEDAERDGDADVDADHTTVRPLGELAGIVAALGVDHRTVGELAGIHQRQPFLEVLHALDAQHRAEHLAVADGHAWLDVVEQRRALVETLLVPRYRHPATVQHQLSAFLDALLDPAGHRIAVLFIDQRAQLAALVVRSPNLQVLHHAGEQRYKLVGDLLFNYQCRQRHAALAGAATGRVDDATRGAFQGGIFEDEGVVLRLGQRLDPLAGRGSGRVD